MPARGTSIRLFLAEGTPDGLWVVEKSNWAGIGLVAPRSGYQSLRSRPEIAGPGVYVLVGPADGSVHSHRIYIGETDELRPRLDSHFKNKEFWTKVVVFTSKDSNLNKAHVRYLESRLIGLAHEAKRSEIENAASSSQPSLSEADMADMEAFLDDLLVLYPVVGLTVFDSPGSTVTAENPRLRLSGKDATATGYETGEGFVVLAGSLARADAVPSMHAYAQEIRSSLVAEGILVLNGSQLELRQDFVFSSPSTAAMVFLGRPANGRTEWRDESGQTLKDFQEKSLPST
jgi:hypothetical protein